jgi:hypothetical protein
MTISATDHEASYAAEESQTEFGVEIQKIRDLETFFAF